MLSTYEQHSRLKLAATVVAILVIAGIVLLADHIRAANTGSAPVQITTADSTGTSSVTGSPDTTPTTTTSGVATDNVSGYKDGVYSTSVSYTVPPDRESIQVDLTLANGIVTSASVKNSENDFDSAQYQEEFASQYKSQVIGKKISGLHVSVIAGASDTTEAFNSALNRIASEAQA